MKRLIWTSRLARASICVGGSKLRFLFGATAHDGITHSSRFESRRKPERGPGPKPSDWLDEHRPTSYWAATRRPFPSLLLVAPLVIAYEWAVIWLGGATPGKLRTGADTWMRNALASLGLADHWLLPLLLVVILLGWQVVSYRDWRFSPGILAGMVVESLVWAVMLVGISRLIDAGFSYLEQRGTGILAIEPGRDDALRLFLDRLRGRRRLRGNAVSADSGPRLLWAPATLAGPAGPREHPGRHRLGVALRAGPPRRKPRRAVHLVRLHLPLDGRRLLRLGLRPARLRDRRRHSHDLRHPGRLDRGELLSRHVPQSLGGSRTVRIVHLSDIHFWRYAFNPLRLLSKRLLGTASLFLGRGRRFRLERVPELVERVQSLDADHLLITGDLTTTALPAEFQHARTALSAPAARPGEGDDHPRQPRPLHPAGPIARGGSSSTSATFAPEGPYPWLRPIDGRTAILGLDPTRAGISARGKLPHRQLLAAPALVAAADGSTNLVIACHYPVAAPPEYEHKLARKPLVNAAALGEWLRTIGPHIYCCGHVHAAWAFRPRRDPQPALPEPRRTAHARPHRPQLPRVPGDHDRGGRTCSVDHHFWTGKSWEVRLLCCEKGFFSLRWEAYRQDVKRIGRG